MKANELMIGDWVYGLYPNGEMYANPFRISAVDIYPTNKSPRIVTMGGYGFQEEHLAPIPITAEFLEKNGFKKSIFRDIEGQHQWSWWRDTLTVVCLWMRELNDNPTDGWMIRIESTPAACCLKISFVHELQHALRLCGISKEIVL